MIPDFASPLLVEDERERGRGSTEGREYGVGRCLESCVKCVAGFRRCLGPQDEARAAFDRLATAAACRFHQDLARVLDVASPVRGPDPDRAVAPGVARAGNTKETYVRPHGIFDPCCTKTPKHYLHTFTWLRRTILWEKVRVPLARSPVLLTC